MSDVIRYGIIGTGMMGCEHIRNLNFLPGAKVTALSDPDETSRGWGVQDAPAGVEVYKDHRELLKRAPVDAVVIATPNHTHRALLEDVLASGKHVLVEKPLCATLEECLHIAERAQTYPAAFWVGMEYRYKPGIQHLIERVREGAIGQLQMISIREHRFPFLKKVGDWNRFNKLTGGTMVEKCCHFFDLMALVAQRKPLRVFASGGQSVNHLEESYAGEVPDILDHGYALIDFQGGLRAMLDLCMFANDHLELEEVVAVGDRGRIAYEGLALTPESRPGGQAVVPPPSVSYTRRDQKRPERREFPLTKELFEAGGHQGATYHLHAAFIAAVRSGGKAAISAEDGALAVAVGIAAQRSISERRPIELRELGF